MLASKHLHQKYPDNPSYHGCVARIYVGLSDQEALWLGAMHNNTGAFHHQLTYKDEVNIIKAFCSGFVQVIENLESHGISNFNCQAWKVMEFK